jgi:hypothetical protein
VGFAGLVVADQAQVAHHLVQAGVPRLALMPRCPSCLGLSAFDLASVPNQALGLGYL